MRSLAARRPARGAACMLVALLAGCAGFTPQPTPNWEHAAARLARLERFTVQGRVAVATAQGGFNASLYWEQDGARYRMRLSGPFGRGAIELEGAPGRVELRTDQEVLTAADARELLERTLGWSLPVAGLRYWARGIPAPDAPVERLELEHGRLWRLEQAGWRVEVQRYAQQGSYTLPAKMHLSSDYAEVRLAVNRWTTG